MKKFFCFFCLLALCSSIYAQQDYSNNNKKKNKLPNSHSADSYNDLEGRRVVVGITFGPTFNWMNWKNHKAAPEGYWRSSPATRVGLRYGLNLDVDLTKEKHFFVSTGVLVEHTGGNLEFDDYVIMEDVTLERKINRTYNSIYLTIPTAVTLRTPSFSNFIICGNVGLYHSFNVYARYQSRFEINPDLPAEVEKEKAFVNHVTTDWVQDKEVAIFKESIFAGLGVEYVIKNNLKAKLYINYAQSLNNYFSKNATNDRTGVKEKASIGTVELLLGLSF
ncbi:MAG: PorT family protein [Bacteroidales bacterium]|nr:PorT family protein [Bacteroidales bacterium]